MRNMILSIGIVLLFTFSFYQSIAQYSTTGTEFWLTYHENFSATATPYLYITSGEGADGTISIPGTGWTQTFAIGVNESVEIQLPAAQAIVSQANTVINRGVHVTSDGEIAVYAANQRNASSDATLVQPVPALGDTYYVNAYTALNNNNPSQFIVLGVENNTNIEIIPTANVIGGVNAGTPFTITLNAGEVYFVRSGTDFTGTLVRATTLGDCNDFAVFAGNKCANVPTTCGYCDHLFEQMIPTKAWGQEYITSPLMTRNGDQFRILAGENNTTVNINNGPDIFLNSGQFHEVYLQPGSYIVGNRPISVAQYSRGTACDGVTSDPFMIMLSPVEQTLDYIVFQAFNTTVINNFYTNVISRTEHTASVTLNGNPMPSWTAVPANPEYSYARQNIPSGTYVLEAPEGALAIVYGFGNADSYGYLAGANIQPLNATFDIIVENDSTPYNQFIDSLSCNQFTVDFATDVEGLTNVSWNINGQEFPGTEATYTFPGEGSYQVIMYYMIENSCDTDSIYTTIHVHGVAPEATSTGYHCIGETAQLFASESLEYLWTGPAGFSSTEQNPIIENFQAENEGEYILETLDENGCEGIATTTLYLHEYPDISAANTGEYCEGETIQLIADPAGMNQYEWSGPGGFSDNGQSVSIGSSTHSMTGEYSVTITDTNGCTSTTSTNVIVHQDVDATIDPIPDLCLSDQIYILSANTPGGTWSGTGVEYNSFDPFNAGVGTHNINYSVENGTCNDSHSTTATVYSNIFVHNFSDNVCDAIYENYTISFDVVDNYDNPTDFYVDDGNGNVLYSGSFSLTIPSATSYSLTVTDANNACDEFVFNGYTDCGCTTFAGTMASLQLQVLCYGECTDMVEYNNNYVLDANDTYQFVLHDGSHPLNIIDRNDSPYFCFHNIPNLNFGQTYYISAIAGDSLPNGDVSLEDDCFSASQGTPVVWYDNPYGSIITNNYSTCGNEVSLTAEEPPPGMFGVWTANADFWPVSGSSIYNHQLEAIVADMEAVTFTWSVSSGNCYGSDQVTVTFLPTPVAYAGSNFAACGNTTQLNAVPSMSGSTGQWAGPGVFADNTSPTTTVTVNEGPGEYVFVWRENIGDCFTESTVTVTFIQEPAPSITVANDTVCGILHELEVLNVQGTGTWTAYQNGNLISPNYLGGSENPNTSVVIPSYSGYHTEIEFIWTETFQTSGVECTGTASQSVVFASAPVASVGSIDEDEVCGHCYTFNADTTGSGFANGTWVAPTVIHSFDNASAPNATVCIDSLVSYGNAGQVRAPFYWVMDYMGCTSIDTINVNFYQRPVANAGLDNAVCGNVYELGAVFNLPNSFNYTPSGVWSVHSKPVPQASENIFPTTHSDSTNVSVSHYGVWEFQFREENANATYCYSTDVVTIEFVEVPIVDAGEDKDVCGQCTQLEGISAGFQGSWHDSGQSFPNGDADNPTADICVNAYGTINFTWQETNFATTTSLACTSIDDVDITFWRQPNAAILTDDADSTTCGLRFNNLRAMNPGSQVSGYWHNVTDPDPVYGDVWSNNTYVTVSTYGYHDFYWIAATGPSYQPDFCIDTAGPLRIHFIERPNANAGGDTLFCGLTGSLSAIPSVGTGVWSTPSSELIGFSDENDPNTQITSQVLSSSTNPYFNLIWTEDNTNECTDRDTIKVRFGRIPSSAINIVPPKCKGEIATVSAQEDSLQQYDWNFSGAIIDSVITNAAGGNYEYFISWPVVDTAHRVTLVATNSWGCQSSISIDTVFQPKIPDFDAVIVGDTCLLGKGGLIFQDTLGQNAFYWLNEDIGPPFNSSFTAVYNLPIGEYDVRARYRTPNSYWSGYYNTVFGNDRCTDTITYVVEPIGLIYADFEVPVDVLYSELVAPNAEVWLSNNSDYGGINRRCVWHFGDGNTLISCDEQVYHTYTEPGCYEPFLIVMNRDLQQCRDTAIIDFCIEVDSESSIEVPNVFTPDGDGINDYFQVKANSIRTFNAYIVNRWGTVVYEWTNWQDEEAGWDGRLSGGTEASSGVYYYIINAIGMDDVEYELQGHLHLLR